MRLSAAIITRDEERNIGDCLRSIDFCDETIVVDSGSSDRTVDIARSLGAKVHPHPFTDFSDQKNFAVALTEGEWVLSVDADERVTDGLKRDILDAVDQGVYGAYRIPRETHFLNRRFRFSGTQDDRPLRLFKRGAGRFVQPIHEYFEAAVPVGDLRSPLVHLTTRTIREQIEKTSRYTDLETRFLLEKRRRVGFLETEARCAAIFAHHYLWKLGFLDGAAGLLYAFYAQRYTRIKYRKLRRAGEASHE